MKHIAAALVTLLLASSAAACSSLKQPSSEELFAHAISVFRARVVEARLAKFPNPLKPVEQVEVVEAKFEIKEVLKGTPPASGVVRDLPFAPGNCSLGLLPGMEYVFFPDASGFVLLPGGSFGYINAEGSEVKSHLEALRKLAGASRQ